MRLRSLLLLASPPLAIAALFACLRPSTTDAPDAATVTALPGPRADAGDADASDGASPGDASTVVELRVPASPDGSTPPALVIHPVRQEPLRGVPTHFDPSGQLVARCGAGDCEVYERASGARHGRVPQARLAGYRTSATSMTAASPDGSLRLVRAADGALALHRAADDAVVARAQRADAACADVGAWHPTEAKVAVPCGQRILVLANDGHEPRWSDPLTAQEVLVPEGFWSGDEPVVLSHAQNDSGPASGPEAAAAAVFWHMAEGAELFSPGVSHVVAVDPVRGCLFDAFESCPCSACYWHVETRVCVYSDALSSRTLTDPEPARRFFSRGGLGIATAELEGLDHGSATHRVEVVRLVAGANTTWSTSLTDYRGALEVLEDGRRLLAGSIDDDRLEVLAADGAKRLALDAAKTLAPEDRKLVVADDEAVVLLVARQGAMFIDLARATVAFRWKDVTGATPSPRGGLVAGTSTRVEVRRSSGALLWSSPEGATSRLLGWLATDGAPALAVEIDGAARSVTFEKGKAHLGAPKEPLALATPQPPALSSKYRLVGRRGIVRTADGARMNLAEDRIYPQATSDASEWADVTSADGFLLGDDVLASELVPLEQVDAVLAKPGSFDAFLRGEPIASASSAPPTLKRELDATGTVVLSTRGAPVGFLEVERGEHTTRIDLEASARIEWLALAKAETIRVRACGVLTPVCSEWESVAGAPP